MALKLLRILVIADRTTVQEICRRHIDHFIARCIDASPASNPTVTTQSSASANTGAGGADAANNAGQDGVSSPRVGSNQSSGDQESSPSRMAALKLVRFSVNVLLFFFVTND